MKTAKEALRHSRHIRNMREDVMSADLLKSLIEAELAMNEVLERKDYDDIVRRQEALYELFHKATPQRSFAVFRENFEIVVVAITVAMGIRTFFLQPFKIPTGSMQPTLWGITERQQDEPGLMDKPGLKYIKWFFTGESFVVYKARNSGKISWDRNATYAHPDKAFYNIGDRVYKFSKRADLRRFPDGTYVEKGTELWRGIIVAGDHVFVDKVSWNFRKPKRAEIMVFSTDDIVMNPLVPKGTHYIKRMAGVPGDRLSIDQPYLVINGKKDGHESQIMRVINTIGYRTIGNADGATSWKPLRTPEDEILMGQKEYFALGDNQASSKDSRFWGQVPYKSLVGPAWLVYWPFVRYDEAAQKYTWHFKFAD